ncbi:MAG: Ca-activated chloride channel [Solirubrobacteraceae bacterium]|nr:Ca-activated chloride channel [Solirubrobacteraceae bacterium]
MTFAAPLVLIGLLGIPVLVALYVAHQHDRARAAAAFATPRLTPSVAPRRPGWRRHAPMLAFALALAILVVAAARPETTVAVPINRAAIMLVNDVSGSMQATDVAPSRLVAARNAAKRFARRVPARVNVGVMAFNEKPQVLQSPTTDRAAVEAALDRLKVSGSTATGEAIQQATTVLRRVPGEGGRRPPAAIVLISDGSSTRGIDPVGAAQAAGRLHIPVYTVALGTPQGTITVPRANGGTATRSVPPDPQSLAQIARASGGRAYAAADADRLSRVYERLGSQLGRKNAKREVTAGFAGGGLALLLLGAAMSLHWFGRLI